MDLFPGYDSRVLSCFGHLTYSFCPSLLAPSEHSEAILFLPPPAPLPLASIAPLRPSHPFLAPSATPDASVKSVPSPPGPPPRLGAHLDPDASGGATPNSSPTSAPTSSTTSTSRPASAQVPLVMAYYPDWVGADYPPENIDFSRFDWIDFAFAVPDQNMALSWDGSDNAPDLLTRLVSLAHANGKHVKLSVGGWTGSKYVPFLHLACFRLLALLRCFARALHRVPCLLSSTQTWHVISAFPSSIILRAAAYPQRFDPNFAGISPLQSPPQRIARPLQTTSSISTASTTWTASTSIGSTRAKRVGKGMA